MVDEKQTLTEPIQLFNQLETFINGLPGSVYWKDKNGVYLGCNDVVVKKGNLSSKQDILGKTDHQVWPEQADSIRHNDLEVINQGQTIATEETVILKTGEKLYFSSVKSPLKDAAGNIIGIIGNSLDITELKEAKQHAESASYAKTQFFALIGHELRIPLTGILSTANMLVESDLTLEEARELGKIIEHSGAYLLSTINSILDYAKLEAQKIDPILTPVNVAELTEEIISILAATAKEKNLALETEYSAALPTAILMDARIIRHILTNLISNAIKYTEQGNVTVSITHINFTADTITLEFAVKDTGIGIPADKLDFIFDRFSQLENAYTRKNSRSGTGLGLSIVKKLIELIDSRIDVQSQLGKGSTFSFVATFSLHQSTPQISAGTHRGKSTVS